jgi:signal transduction histidine kinase
MLVLGLAIGIAKIVTNTQRMKDFFTNSIEEIHRDYEREKASIQVDAEENTLVHVAREIHDHICQSIVLAIINLQTMEMVLQKDSPTTLISTTKLLQDTLEQLRHFSRTINTDAIGELGLIQSIQNQLKYIESTGILKVKLNIEGESRYMSCEKELTAFRVIQESLANTMRHADASIFDIRLIYDNMGLSIRMKDNGIGFEEVKPITNGSTGIINMRNRATLNGGNFKINSKPGEGTTTELVLPY